MNFIPNKHEINSGISGRESKRERERKDNFCVINVTYKEISWRVRKGRRGEEGGKK